MMLHHLHNDKCASICRKLLVRLVVYVALKPFDLPLFRRKNKAASIPNKSAKVSNSLTVGSVVIYIITYFALNIAFNISTEGFVTVSLTKFISIYQSDTLFLIKFSGAYSRYPLQSFLFFVA